MHHFNIHIWKGASMMLSPSLPTLASDGLLLFPLQTPEDLPAFMAAILNIAASL
jgi:hypothetical protein